MAKKAILFVDDDGDEIKRFETHLNDHYIIGAGQSLTEAVGKLKDNRVKAPDLILLDLYHGGQVSEEQRHRMGIADEALAEHERYVKAMLTRLGQDADKGFELAQEARQQFPGTACAFFSRKAFLKDALRAYNAGLPVFEKPDPEELALNEAAVALISKFEKDWSQLPGRAGNLANVYDEAFQSDKQQLVDRFNQLISENSWFERWRERLSGFFLAAASFTVERCYGFWHDGQPWKAAIMAIVTGVLVVSWWKFWRKGD